MRPKGQYAAPKRKQPFFIYFKMKTNYFLRLWQVVLAMTLWAATITALPCGAQDGGDTSLPMIRHLHGDGLYNPLYGMQR